MIESKTKGLTFNELEDGFLIEYGGRQLFKHSNESPMIFLGRGNENIEMYRGNFKMDDYILERIKIFPKYIESKDEKRVEIHWTRDETDETVVLRTFIYESDGRLQVKFHLEDSGYNRSWIRIKSDENEKVYGCGEQLSYFNLKGRNFPLWTSEPGVGRNKSTYTTYQADVKDKAGGDYYTTNYPQPTFMTTNKYYCHTDTTVYSDFNFKNDGFHELHFWGMPNRLIFGVENSYKVLQYSLSELLGRQPELPDWTYNGVWLGIQGGTDIVEEKLKKAEDVGLKVGAVWLQDWQGRNITSFGKRLNWNWQWDEKQYPELDSKIGEWNKKDIKFLGYLNPYVVNTGELFAEAQKLGLLAKNSEGEDYLVDFGEFYCGIIDFTNPEGYAWYKQMIKENAIDFGMSGWMADFGEYLPTDVVLHDGSSAMDKHNEWPNLWAKVNREAVQESGKWGEIVYFMRAGYTGIQSNCTLLWAGDQSVNWSLDDGLASVIPAALSAGVSGMGLHHSDIGGYTSLHGNKRSKELFMRWTDMAAFTPVMRTHEGNRPDDCFQYDGDEECLMHLKRMTDIYVSLKEYMKECVKENTEKGIAVQRPLFYEYEEDEKSYDTKYQYMLGPELLVAPVYEKGAEDWSVHLPEDEWVHLWTNDEYEGGNVTVNAPIGKPPVFYRKKSDFKELFETVKDL